VHVSELYLYPIKSARGIPLERASLDDRGFQHDRRWMLVDESNALITAREQHQLLLVDVKVGAHVLTVSAPGMDVLRVPLEVEGATERCRVWRDWVDAIPVSAEAHEWFGNFLGTTCRLVFMPDTTKRIVDRNYVEQDRLVGFADAFPLLIIGQGSLDRLNERLVAQGESALPMRRFRPNIVVADTQPYEEDEWQHIRVGEVDVDVVKPCARCVITTMDTETAETSREPLRTLATYRRHGSKVLFGQNAVHRQHGEISVGDAVTVVSRKTQ
jgi:uncharacterized protein